MGETNLANVPPLSDSMQWTNDTTHMVAYISLRMQRVLPVCRAIRVTVGTTPRDNVSRPFGSVKHSKYTVHYQNLGQCRIAWRSGFQLGLTRMDGS